MVFISSLFKKTPIDLVNRLTKNSLGKIISFFSELDRRPIGAKVRVWQLHQLLFILKKETLLNFDALNKDDIL